MAPDPSCPRRVLVVADNAAIGRHAIRWADAFARASSVHRVRLVAAADPRAVDAAVAEATSLGATAILAAGDHTARAVAAAVAARLGLPLARDEAADAGDG